LSNSSYKDIWLNSYPVFFALVLEPTVSLVDSFVGSKLGLLQLSGIGVGESIYGALVWGFIFLAYGTTPLISSLRSDNDFDNVIKLIEFGRKLVYFFGTLTFLVIFFYSDNLISLFKPVPEVAEYARSYIIPRTFGIIFYLYILHTAAVLRGLRKASATLIAAVIAGGINIIFDFIFVFVLNLGLFGIGLASTLAYCCSSVYLHVILLREVSTFKSNQETSYIDIRKSFFSIGSAILLRSFFLVGMMTLMKNFASRISSEAIALNHLLLYIWNIFVMSIDSVAVASQTLVAEKISNGSHYWRSELSESLIKICFVLATLVYLIISFFLVDFVEILSNTETLNSATENLKFLVAGTLFIGFFAFLWDGVLLGLGSSKHFATITICGSSIGTILLFYSFINDFGLMGLWFSLLISLVVRASMGYYYQKLG
jgi:putative MATE family efflux protein